MVFASAAHESKETWFLLLGHRPSADGAVAGVEVVEETCVFSWFHEDVISLILHHPVYAVLVAFWTTTARPGERVAWWRVDCDGEEIWWIREIGDKAAMSDKVAENEDIH